MRFQAIDEPVKRRTLGILLVNGSWGSPRQVNEPTSPEMGPGGSNCPLVLAVLYTLTTMPGLAIPNAIYSDMVTVLLADGLKDRTVIEGIGMIDEKSHVCPLLSLWGLER